VPFKGVDAIKKQKVLEIYWNAQTWVKQSPRKHHTKSKTITTAAFQAFLLTKVGIFSDQKCGTEFHYSYKWRNKCEAKWSH
jgi:hypothetical protein